MRIAPGDRFTVKSNTGIEHRVFCRDIMEPGCIESLIGGEEVAGILADPPYASGGNSLTTKRQDVNQKYGTTRSYLPYSNDALDQLSWITWSRTWIREAQSLVPEGSSLMVFVDWRQLAAMQTAVQLGGWVFRGIAPWDKTSSSRPAYPGGGFRHQAEYVIWTSKGRVQREGGKPQLGVFSRPVDRDKVHIHQKPAEVYGWLIRGLFKADGPVFDPFAGSLSVVIAADQEERECIAVEMNPAILEKGLQRLIDSGFTVKKGRDV